MASAANVVDPLPSCPSPRTARQPFSYLDRGDPEVPPFPSSPPLMASPDPSDRSPQKTPPPPDDVAPASASSSDSARGKKPAWKRPPNGSIEAGAAVMGGAAAWPALSESAKFGSKSPSSDALKSLSDGPPSAPLGPAVSNSSPKPNLNPSINSNHVVPARQKSMKRGGSNSGSSGNSASSDDGMVHSSPSPTPQPNSVKQALPEISPRDQPAKNTSNWDHASRGGALGSQANDGGDHLRGYGGNRRWNSGGGGSGSHHNSFGNRYDGYRRNAGGRDVNLQQRNPRPYLRLPVSPVAPPFLSPPPQVRPFGNPPMVFSDMHSPVLYVATQPPPVGVPFVPHPAVPPAMFIPAIDPQRASLLHQIDYYFSSDNLCRDVYLRQNMDEQGWVPISLIAGFNRVRQLTNNIDFILDTVRLSNIVEVQGDKIRRHNDWMNWVLPSSSNQLDTASSQSPATPNSDRLAVRLQSVALDGSAVQSSSNVPNLVKTLVGNPIGNTDLEHTRNFSWGDDFMPTVTMEERLARLYWLFCEVKVICCPTACKYCVSLKERAQCREFLEEDRREYEKLTEAAYVRFCSWAGIAEGDDLSNSIGTASVTSGCNLFST